MKIKDDRWCFACGTRNPIGLHMEGIHLEAGECVCRYTPRREHQGWAGILHGGITSTLVDEIMTHNLFRRGFDAVTAEMTVRLKAPIPTGAEVLIRAWMTERRGRVAFAESEVTLPDGTLAASASARFVYSVRGPDDIGAPEARLTLAARASVIFDLFGTLVPVFRRDPYQEMLAQMAGLLGVPAGEFAAAFRADAQDRVTGRWDTLQDNLTALAAAHQWTVTEAAVQAAVEVREAFTLRSLLNPYPETLEVLAALREAGRTIGLISDCSPETPACWHRSPLAQFIPEPVFSPTAHLRKPDPAIYRLALERNGLDPARTVFVGDGDSNELPGARALGILPVLIDRGEDSAFRVSPSHDGVDVIVHDLRDLLPLIGLEPTPPLA